MVYDYLQHVWQTFPEALFILHAHRSNVDKCAGHLYRDFLDAYKSTDYHIKMLYLSSQLLKTQDLNIVNLCSYITHTNDVDRFLQTADGFTFSLEEIFFTLELIEEVCVFNWTD